MSEHPYETMLKDRKEQSSEEKSMLPENYLELGMDTTLPEGSAEWAKAIEESQKDLDPKKDCGPQPGPPRPPHSLNARFILEPYQEDRALKSTVKNGFAMVSQKVNVKGLKVLTDVQNQTGQWIAYKGDIAYIREEYLHSQAWAKKAFSSDAIEGDFMIVDVQYVEFVVSR